MSSKHQKHRRSTFSCPDVSEPSTMLHMLEFNATHQITQTDLNRSIWHQWGVERIEIQFLILLIIAKGSLLQDSLLFIFNSIVALAMIYRWFETACGHRLASPLVCIKRKFYFGCLLLCNHICAHQNRVWLQTLKRAGHPTPAESFINKTQSRCFGFNFGSLFKVINADQGRVTKDQAAVSHLQFFPGAF